MSNKSKLFLAAIFSFLLLGCSDENVLRPTDGMLDYSHTDIRTLTHHNLEGKWKFYWNYLLTPQDFKNTSSLPEPAFVPIPASWTAYQDSEGNNYSHFGFATYRLTINVSENLSSEDLGLFIPKIWGGSKVWVNDTLVNEAGVVSTNPDEFHGFLLEKLVRIQPKDGKLDIVVHIANYDHFLAGMLESMRFGEYDFLMKETQLNNTFTLMWLGVLLIMSLYHFILFFFRKKTKSTLYFGIICLLIAVRLMVFGDHYVYEFLKSHTSILGFQIQYKTYYLTTFYLVSIGLLYVKSLYTDESSEKAIKVFIILQSIYTLFLLAVPASLSSPTITIFQVIVIVPSVLYLIFILIWATIRRRSESTLQILGIAFMVFAGVNDILHLFGIEIVGEAEFIPAGFAVFLILQFIVIAKRMSNAFHGLEDLTINLEKKVKERTKEVTEKKEEIETQNEQLESAFSKITDSVRYASRIQRAILGDPLTIENAFRAYPRGDAFIYFSPKDIVSGDFYWYSEIDNKQIIIAADCTGHGVPGAFMTILMYELLDEVIKNNGITRPNEILLELDKRLINVLNKESNISSSDGADMAVLTIDREQQILEFAGAKNPLFVVRKDEKGENQIHRVKGSKFPVGNTPLKAQKQFDLHEFILASGDTLYIASDGFQDQFGGPDNKKYMAKPFREFLNEISPLPMSEQKNLVDEELSNWKANKEGNVTHQTDDILIVGIKL